MTSVEFRYSGAARSTATNRNIRNTVRGNFTKKIVKKGLRYARRIMPKDTGAMYRSLQAVYRKRSAQLILRQPNHADGRNRPYHMWMHGIKAIGVNTTKANKGYDTSEGRFKPISGEPKFMEKTFRYMRELSKIEKKKLAGKLAQIRR